MFIPISANEKILLPEKGDVTRFWHDAVRYGETHANIALPSMIEEHLVSTLVEYLHDTFLMDTPVAIHFLEGIEKNDLIRLARAASVSLLILGLFPGRIERMLVSPSYLLSVGQSSYDHLAVRWETIRRTSDAELARKARDSFEPMARVLRGMRTRENVFTLPIPV